jgi:transcriptional regulator with GAF, ATPase, and Fis domain
MAFRWASARQFQPHWVIRRCSWVKAPRCKRCGSESRRPRQLPKRLNCPALSPQLLESELFGHERGAFTSADAPRIGRFELADRGTIFLDEITEIDATIQSKLLRVLQERTFERVGSSTTQKVDVRVITAANRDLRAEVKAGRFREDLYFRLAVIPIAVPALRERLDDIPELANHFLSAVAGRMGRAALSLKACALGLLQAYSWPGNVRELENLLTRASVLCVGEAVSADELRPWLGEVVAAPIAAAPLFRRRQTRRNGTPTHRSHAPTLPWPPRSNRQRARHRRPHPNQ